MARKKVIKGPPKGHAAAKAKVKAFDPSAWCEDQKSFAKPAKRFKVMLSGTRKQFAGPMARNAWAAAFEHVKTKIAA